MLQSVGQRGAPPRVFMSCDGVTDLQFGEGNPAKARTSGADTQPPINLCSLTPY